MNRFKTSPFGATANSLSLAHLDDRLLADVGVDRYANGVQPTRHGISRCLDWLVLVMPSVDRPSGPASR